MKDERTGKLEAFIAELSEFALRAEEALKKIETDPHGNKGEFEQFSEMMIAIRGTALQLELPSIAEIAGFGEEIALRGPQVEKGSQIKKCVGALWDALTTVKYMLGHPAEAVQEEHEILRHRLQSTLKSLGGPRETMTADEVEALIRRMNPRG